jgi:4-amino-4-deoxy-L-arabinose transferase-like glycosyltransferase
MSTSTPAGTRFTSAQWLLLALGSALLVIFWLSRISTSPIVWDAAENLHLTLNVAHHHAFSQSEQEPLQPSTYREPLPILFSAVAVDAVDAALGPTDNSDYFQGRRARLLKYQNLVWMAVLTLVTFALARELGITFNLSLVCVAALNLLLLTHDVGYFMLDSLYTEALASALLCLASLLLLKGLRRNSLTWLALAGISFGLLILVKALFLYLIATVAIFMVLLSPWLHRSYWVATRQAAALVILALLVILPWMLRNLEQVGYFAITQRGGEVLYDRAMADQMTRDEYIGAYFMYAPYPLDGILRRILGYSRSDLEFGGRLQRLNESPAASFYVRDYSAELAGRPEDAVTYMHRAGADRVRLRMQLEQAGDLHAEPTSDRLIQQRATQMIRQHLFSHLELIPLYLWQGAFFCFPVLVLAAIVALRRRRIDVLLMLWPATGSLLFYASVAHLEPRYAIPTFPIVVCALAAVASGMRPGPLERTAQSR